MQRDLISISEAARRIGVNKSTLSRQIRAGLIRSHDGKVRLAEVQADRLSKLDPARRSRETGPVVNEPFEAVSLGQTEFMAGAIWGALVLIYRTGAAAAILASTAGASMKVAHALGAALPVAMAADLESICGLPGDALQLEPEALSKADWTKLAAIAGEPVDLTAWAAFTQERFGA